MKEVGGSSRRLSAEASVSSASGTGHGKGWTAGQEMLVAVCVCSSTMNAKPPWPSLPSMCCKPTNPGQLLGETQDGAVGGGVLKVGIIHGVACRGGAQELPKGRGVR